MAKIVGVFKERERQMAKLIRFKKFITLDESTRNQLTNKKGKPNGQQKTKSIIQR